MCLAVNPYKWLPLYNDTLAAAYLANAEGSQLPPHVYAIGSNAFHAMRRMGRDQSILVSGESGAGKTGENLLRMYLSVCILTLAHVVMQKQQRFS